MRHTPPRGAGLAQGGYNYPEGGFFQSKNYAFFKPTPAVIFALAIPSPTGYGTAAPGSCGGISRSDLAKKNPTTPNVTSGET